MFYPASISGEHCCQPNPIDSEIERCSWYGFFGLSASAVAQNPKSILMPIHPLNYP